MEDETLTTPRFSSLLDRFFNDSLGQYDRLTSFVPEVDIIEDESKYEIHVAAPGMKKEDFKVELNQNQLSVSGERKFNKEEKGKTYHRVETRYGSFMRSFYVPDAADASKIEAEYKDGLLVVKMPKDQQKQKTVQLTVK